MWNIIYFMFKDSVKVKSKYKFPSTESKLSEFRLINALENQRSGYNIAHVTTAQLSWHVQYCDLIWPCETKLGQEALLQDFNFELINNLLNLRHQYNNKELGAARPLFVFPFSIALPMTLVRSCQRRNVNVYEARTAQLRKEHRSSGKDFCLYK